MGIRGSRFLIVLVCASFGLLVGSCTEALLEESQVTSAFHKLQVSPSGMIGALIMDEDRAGQIADTFMGDMDLSARNLSQLIQFLYAGILKDDVDFVIFVLDPSLVDEVSEEYADTDPNFFQAMRFPDEGIGAESVKIESVVGPDSLRGAILLSRPWNLVRGAILHEIGHAWGVYLTGPPSLARAARTAYVEESEVDFRERNHWNNAQVDGLIGVNAADYACYYESGEYSFAYADEGDVISTFDYPPFGFRDMAPYAMLELYLMGLASPEDVEPIDIYPDDVHSEIARGQLYCIDENEETVYREHFEGEIVTVTIDEIIEHNGERIPSIDESPKSFKAALFVLAASELTDTQWDAYERARDFISAPEERDLKESFPESLHPVWYQDIKSELDLAPDGARFHNFYMATRGRATLEFVMIDPTGT